MSRRLEFGSEFDFDCDFHSCDGQPPNTKHHPIITYLFIPSFLPLRYICVSLFSPFFRVRVQVESSFLSQTRDIHSDTHTVVTNTPNYSSRIRTSRDRGHHPRRDTERVCHSIILSHLPVLVAGLHSLTHPVGDQHTHRSATNSTNHSIHYTRLQDQCNTLRSIVCIPVIVNMSHQAAISLPHFPSFNSLHSQCQAEQFSR